MASSYEIAYSSKIKEYKKFIIEKMGRQYTDGVKIIWDNKLDSTKKVFIETAKKLGNEYVPSGIMAGNNWGYLIGNMDMFYLFNKITLKNGKRFIIDGNNGTTKGFTLTSKQANREKIIFRCFSQGQLPLIPEELVLK